MKPKKPEVSPEDLFRNKLENIINMSHPLVKLSEQLNWAYLDEQFGALYTEGFGRPGLATRLMAGLHFLKHMFDESDESVVERFLENPYWQYFCGREYFEHRLPLDPTSLVKWRQRIGAERMEAMLKVTIEAAQNGNHLKCEEVKRVVVDTTVQEKAIAFPTDARLRFHALNKLVQEAKRRQIHLRQTYTRTSKHLYEMQSRYRHARKYKLAQKATNKLRTLLGRVIRDIERNASGKMDASLRKLLTLSQRIHKQKTDDKNKIYSLHAPEVECISKGKDHKKYEFGCKASFVSTLHSNWIVGAHALHGNSYDGHTLDKALNQAEKLSGGQIQDAYCDRGYRGAKLSNTECRIHLAGQRRKELTRTERKRLKRRSAIEPIIGHVKQDNRMKRNYLKGAEGDNLNVVLSACGFNMRKLLRAFFLSIWNWLRECWLAILQMPILALGRT